MSIQVSMAIQAAREAKKARISEWNSKQFLLRNFMHEISAEIARKGALQALDSAEYWHKRSSHYENQRAWRLMSMSIDYCINASNRKEEWKKLYRDAVLILKSNRQQGKNIVNLP